MSRPSRSLWSVLFVWPSLALLAGATGCAAPLHEPEFVAGQQSDGMRPVEPVPYQRTWVRPGASFEGYSSALVRFAGVAYRHEPRPGQINNRRRSSYPASQGLRDRLMDGLRSAFERAIAQDEAIGRSERAGESVLLVHVSLIDFVLWAPVGRTAPQENFWVDSVGTFTLVVDIYDSQSGKLLARAADRQAINSGGSNPIRADTGDTTYHSFRIFRGWADRFGRLMAALRIGRFEPARTAGGRQLTRVEPRP